MANVIITPNMNLPNPVPGVDPGPDYANNIQSSLNIVDQHTHTSGSGLPITPAAINVNANLPMAGFGTTGQGSVGFLVLGAPLSGSILNTLYAAGVDLYYNDGSGNQIQITKAGLVNATSSGIASGTATASFSAGVLIVDAASLTPANIQVASVLLGNNVASSHFLTLSPPNAMGSSFTLTLPFIPGAATLLGMDTSGNFTTNASQIVTAANILNQTITGAQIANQTITATQIANSTITGTQIATNVNLPGVPQAGGLDLLAQSSGTNGGLKVIRGGVDGTSGALAYGEGWSGSITGTYQYNLAWTTPFSSTPAVIFSPVTGGVAALSLISATASGAALATTTQQSFTFIAIGPR